MAPGSGRIGGPRDGQHRPSFSHPKKDDGLAEACLMALVGLMREQGRGADFALIGERVAEGRAHMMDEQMTDKSRRPIDAKYAKLHASLKAEIAAEVHRLMEPKREKFHIAFEARFGPGPWSCKVKAEFVAAATEFTAWLTQELEDKFVLRIRALDEAFARECGLAIMPDAGSA